MSNLIRRFLVLILAVTSVGVTLVLLVVGYQVALAVMAGGHTSGQLSMVVLGTFPSLFALLSLPFWLTLRRMQTREDPIQPY